MFEFEFLAEILLCNSSCAMEMSGKSLLAEGKLPVSKGDFRVYVTHAQCKEGMSTSKFSKETFNELYFAAAEAVITAAYMGALQQNFQRLSPQLHNFYVYS